jgi:hypothetical protein
MGLTAGRKFVNYYCLYLSDDFILGITDGGQYVYSQRIGSTDHEELYELTHDEYLAFIEADQAGDTERLKQMCGGIYLKPSIAFGMSPTEPLPVCLPRYGSSKRDEYINFITANIIKSAKLTSSTIILHTTADKKKQFEKINLT